MSTTITAATGVGNGDGVVEGLAKDDPRTGMGSLGSPMFGATGTDVDVSSSVADMPGGGGEMVRLIISISDT